LTAKESRTFFLDRKTMRVTGYPVRSELSSWTAEEAYQIFGFSPEVPTLLVTGGSLGSLTINRALVGVLPKLLAEMQIIHITGKFTWPQFSSVGDTLSPTQAARYRIYPYLHAKMGAAYTIADLVVSRAGASTIGEYPHFGIPAVLVPYPHAWRYQWVNADFLSRHQAAVILEDSNLADELLPTVLNVIRDPERLIAMQTAMRSLAQQDAGGMIATLLYNAAATKSPVRN
jgi:UDP-N-acetylglucosamine--N-acetylmuramyl-(pentapeptide) pyrophosphoryl-undecaprenol N-acetylglucosamine transferase